MSVILKFSIIDADFNKTLKIHRTDTVWSIKLQLIAKLQKAPPNGAFNHGIFCPPISANRPGGFLEEHRLMWDYNFPNNSSLILKPKTRDVTGIPEKQWAKVNDKKQRKALMDYISKKSVTKVKDLLDKGLDPNFIHDNGETPLTLAALQDSTEMIMLLVQQGGAFTDFRASDWRTPLHKAVFSGSLKAVSALLSVGAHTDVRDKENMTPLYLASVMGKPACAEALLEAGSMFNVADDNGRTELHQACLKDSPGVAKLLIEFGADIMVKNLPGNTPLHVCGSSNSVECAKLLLAAGADKEIQNGAGDTPSQVAIMTNNWDIAEFIGNYKGGQSQPRGKRQANRRPSVFPNSLYLQIHEYVPPPPPPGYKGICKPPPEAPPL